MSKIKANVKIRKAMLANEREALKFVRQFSPYSPRIPGSSLRKALERLEAKGKIRYSHAEPKHGYVVNDVKTNQG